MMAVANLVWSIEQIVNLLTYDGFARYNRAVGNLMDRAVLGGIEFEYVVRGGAEPVVLVHPGIFAGCFPNVEPFVLPNATHLLQIDNPRGMAEGLAWFFARHPLTVAA